jgi:hypothetical protein
MVINIELFRSSVISDTLYFENETGCCLLNLTYLNPAKNQSNFNKL